MIFAAMDNGSFVYNDIAVVGHSLGSVLSYDTVNKLMYADLLKPALDVVGRTRLLVTMACPLNKTAYVFSAKPGTGYIRESLGAQVQPLINDPSSRTNVR